MKQREIERLSGRMAFFLWMAFLAVCLLVGYTADAVSHETRTFPTNIVAKQPRTKRGAKTQQTPAPLSAQPLTDEERNLQGMSMFALLLFVAAISATSWWNWRRKQRIRIEIRAEAYDGRRRHDSLRNSRAAGI